MCLQSFIVQKSASVSKDEMASVRLSAAELHSSCEMRLGQDGWLFRSRSDKHTDRLRELSLFVFMYLMYMCFYLLGCGCGWTCRGVTAVGMGAGSRMADGLRISGTFLPSGSAGRGFWGGWGFSNVCEKGERLK